MTNETALQRAIVRTLTAAGFMVERINAGQRGGARMAPQGRPDLDVIGFGHLEVKLEGGSLSNAQVTWHQQARRHGARVEVVRSVREAIEVCQRWRAGR